MKLSTSERYAIIEALRARRPETIDALVRHTEQTIVDRELLDLQIAQTISEIREEVRG
jgi:hypothetical protein